MTELERIRSQGTNGHYKRQTGDEPEWLDETPSGVQGEHLNCDTSSENGRQSVPNGTISPEARRFYELMEQADGFRFTKTPDGMINVSPASKLTNEHRQQIKQYRGDLLRLIDESVATELARKFPPFVPFSKLEAASDTTEWLVDCLIVREGISLLSGLPKAGKSTLLSRILLKLIDGSPFAGRLVRKGTAWVISEEAQGRWRIRGDKLGYTDALSFLCRPSMIKPTMQWWNEFVLDVTKQADAAGVNLIVLDTLAGLWPCKNENDAAEVQECLTPLLTLAKGRSVVIIHHLKKNDAGEGTASRGSGAIAGFVDCILELRRYDPLNNEDTRRVLKCYGRPDNITPEVVLNFVDGQYESIGDKSEAVAASALKLILEILPTEGEGLKTDEIKEQLPEGSRIRRSDLLAGLNLGIKDDFVHRNGRGKPKDPYRYVRVGVCSLSPTGTEQTTRPPSASVPLFREHMGTEGTDTEENSQQGQEIDPAIFADIREGGQAL